MRGISAKRTQIGEAKFFADVTGYKEVMATSLIITIGFVFLEGA